MAFKYVLLACFAASVAVGSPQRARISNFNFDLSLDNQLRENTTPVPILRYIDTQNPDGSYTYGYESGDGTYKIETRYQTGEVKGKYGYYDDTGSLREVEYGASPNRGFEPKSEGLVVAPPTISLDEEFQPAPQQPIQPARPANQRFSNFAQEQVKTVNGRRAILRKRPVRPTPAPVAPAPRQQFLPTLNTRAQQQSFIPQPVQPALPVNIFSGHPAQNIDLQSGSYTVQYSG